MNDLTQQGIEDQIRRYGFWFQNLNLHGIETNPSRRGHCELRWELIEPYVPDDLTGKSVLDLGCNAGYFSIKMKERGATVLGVDWFPEAIEQARFAAGVLGLEIKYHLQNIYEFVLTNTKSFDYVLFLGVFYHLRYPLLILDRLGGITDQKLYFQTLVREVGNNEEPALPENLLDYELMGHPGFPSMYFIERSLAGAFNNWFVCNRNGIYAILRSSGFRKIRSSGREVFICDPPTNLEESWRDSHDLSSLKLGEPVENADLKWTPLSR